MSLKNRGDVPPKPEGTRPQNQGNVPQKSRECDSRCFFGLGLGDLGVRSFLRRDRCGLAPAPTTPTRIGAFSTQKDKTLGCPPAAANPPPAAERARPQKRPFWPQNGARLAPESAAPNGAELTPKTVVIILTPCGTVSTPKITTIFGSMHSKVIQSYK